ncbi:MAG: DNA-processing protein DprA [Alphaproteobacteria bacterium]|nr:DNA-processing protein DprA [Alphaproteobacteria bacterium]
MDQNTVVDYLRLINTEGIGPSWFYKYVQKYGSVCEAVKQLSLTKNLFSSKDAQKELETAFKQNIKIITCEDELYPPLLKELNDAPPVLYAKGHTELLKYPATLSVVGSRNASVAGRKIASRIAYDLTNADVLVISGMARGIDSAAHKGALYAQNTKGPTIAVLGTGIDVCYPEENMELYEQIADQGLLISEFKLGEKANISNFPRRNRLVAGLSLGTLVVEASLNSGSLITARLALEQGKDIFAVPTSPFENKAAGCNKLIKEGAVLTENADDILQTLALTQTHTLKISQKATLAPKSLDFEKKEVIMQKTKSADKENGDILQTIGASGIEQDELIRHLNMQTSAALVKITELELEGVLVKQNGSFLMLTKEGLEQIK